LDAQVGVDRANLQVKSTLNSVEDAQRRYNLAVEKYGEDSVEAAAAADDLKLAQERYALAVERADMVQGNFSEKIVASALSIIPTAITMVASLGTAFTAMGMTGGIATMAIDGVSMALSFLAAHPIVLAVMAIVAALVLLWNLCPPFREAVIALGESIAKWFGDVWNSIRPALEGFWNNVLVPFGQWLCGVFGAIWNALCTGIGIAYNSYIKPVWDALNWVWSNILVPIGDFLKGALLSAWNALGGGIQSAWNTFIKPVFDAFAWAYNSILLPILSALGLVPAKASSATSSLNATTTAAKNASYALNNVAYSAGVAASSAANAVALAATTVSNSQATYTTGVNTGYGHVPVMAEGGIVMGPTLALIGEKGPEAVVPLRESGGQKGLGGGLVINGPLVVVEGSADEHTALLAAELVMDKVRRIIQT